MELDHYYVALLKKGPNWTGSSSAQLEALQERHLAHIRAMSAAGELLLAGPLEDHSAAGDLRGISIFNAAAFASLAELRERVEQDPMFQVGHLAADYLTWHVPAGTRISLPDPR